MPLDSLGRMARSEFMQFEKDRRDIEDRWLKSWRQYRGKYEPDILSKMHPQRSRIFVKLTRTKTITAAARLADMLFPTGDKNWGVSPTPVPDFSDDEVMAIAQSLAQRLQREPTPEEVMLEMHKLAQEKVELMEQEMHDQLIDMRYTRAGRMVIHNGVVLGTGILKGPLVRYVDAAEVIRGPEGFSMQTTQKMQPYAESVPPWDIYVDLSVTDPQIGSAIYQRHVMNKTQLRELRDTPGFFRAGIEEVLEQHPYGTSSGYKTHEQELRAVHGTDHVDTAGKNKYEVLERWGTVASEELRELTESYGEEYDLDSGDMEAVIWTVNDKVIRAAPNPFSPAHRPYHFYVLEPDDTGVYGPGIPENCEDSQTMINSATRVMIDNAAITAGPQIEVMLDRLVNDEDADDIFPFKIWTTQGRGGRGGEPALRVYNIDSHMAELLQIIELAKRNADEETAIPSFLHGEAPQGGVGRTTGGMSMLTGASNLVLKDYVKQFDEGITIPFIRALYQWNMQFNEREEIKGPADVYARGSSHLVAKEVLGPALELFAQNTQNDRDAPYVDAVGLLKARAKANDLPVDQIIKTHDEAQQLVAQQAQAESEQANADREAERDLKTARAERERAQAAKLSGEAQDDGTKREEALARIDQIDATTEKMYQDMERAEESQAIDLLTRVSNDDNAGA